MALADPQSVTIGSAHSLPRTGSGLNLGAFTKDDGNVKLEVSHQFTKGGRVRRTARVVHRKVAADPLAADRNLEYSATAYVVFDVPLVGYTIAEAVQVGTGLTTWLTASTNANMTKVMGGES